VVAELDPAGETALGMQHPVKAAFLTDIQTTVCKEREDLHRRQRLKFRLIARE
jgi:hypothetical protein